MDIQKKQALLILLAAFLLLFSSFGISFAEDNPARCLKGNCSNGQGRFVTVYGKIYTGEIRNGIPNGKGMYLYPDGKLFYGFWKENRLNGYGVYISPDGYKYVGEWKDNRFNGQGTLTFPDGKKISGDFKNDKYIGIIKSKPKERANAELEQLLKESEQLSTGLLLP